MNEDFKEAFVYPYLCHGKQHDLDRPYGSVNNLSPFFLAIRQCGYRYASSAMFSFSINKKCPVHTIDICSELVWGLWTGHRSL